MEYIIYHNVIEMKKFKSTDVIRMAGVTKVQLNHWINMLAIEPRYDDRRRGGVRYFSQQNLVEAFICKNLNELRLPVQAISGALQTIRGQKIISGKTFFEAYTTNPKLEKYFLLILSLTDRPIPKYLSDKFKKNFHRIVRPTVVCPAKELSVWFSKFPTAVVVNLNQIVQEAGGL
jgi:DNA-binding transcriptional MerR regulator